MNEIIDTNATVSSNSPMNQKLPNAGGVLAMGIISIVLAGLIGLILGIIALSTSKKSLELYRSNPGNYDPSSYSQLKGGRVCAIIGLSISSFALFIILLVIVANA